MFYVYILQDKDIKKNYIGFTENLKSRIKSHNSKALEFEKYLKHGSGHAFAKKRFI